MNKVNVRMYSDMSNQLGYYLAGLIEGDGSIILRKGVASQEKKFIQKSFLLSV